MIVENPLIKLNASADSIIIEPVKITDSVSFRQNDTTAAVYPGIECDTREGLRKYTKNAAKAVGPLQKVVDDFARYVNICPKDQTYAEIYKHFLNIWFKECDLLRARKLKTVIIDSHWFAMQYAPQV